MQRFPNDAKLKRVLLKFVQVKVSRSERRFRPYQKQIIRKYKNDSYSRQTTRIRKWPTELRKKLSSSKVTGQQRKYKIDLHGSHSLIKQQQLYWPSRNIFFRKTSNERLWGSQLFGSQR
ncbi:hypothetical protein pdam_00021179 [Pocillopora damicornis]|uniref:Uncharacterized protein n=1 Tax=Pocillopora damicornis TaxID=46731 RepID=A0A3M6TWF3_POCDA|nr:hypothetical protein pdam_00021179 [Pocillopora damicornis]